MRRLILAAVVLAAIQPAFARSAMETNQLVDDNGAPIGTAANPLFVSGGSGGGGGGTVTQGQQGSSSSPWFVTLPSGQTVNVGNFPATQLISAASLPLPAGAATAANQNATAAGTSAASAQAVQGVTGGVPQNVAQVDTIPAGSPFSSSAGGTTIATFDTTGAASADLAVSANANAIFVEAGDGAGNWNPLPITNIGNAAGGTARVSNAIGGIGLFRISTGGKTVRLRALSAGTGTTVAVVLKAAPWVAPSTWVEGGAITAAISNPYATTTANALQPPTAASGKITRTPTALAASTSTTIAAANANRIALALQCASGGVSVDETGAALTAAGVGNGTLFVPSGTAPYFTPPIATLSALTAYTATAQTCVVTEYLR